MKSPALAILLAGLACAQTSSSAHSGWNFDDTLQTAGAVLVGDVISGASLDLGSKVAVSLKVRVVRVLKGGLVPGAELNIAWQYDPSPLDGPAVTAKPPADRALWFLKKNGDAFEALEASIVPLNFGGRVVPMPAGAPSGDLMYAPGAPFDTKLASEAAWAMLDIAAHHGADLDPSMDQRTTPRTPGAMPQWAVTRMRFESLMNILTTLDKQAAAPVFRWLSASGDAHLQVAGLAGRLNSGDASALLELERELPHLAQTFDMRSLPRYLAALDFTANPEAGHALGRIALSEWPIPGIEGGFFMAAGRAARLEYLPYMVAMLRSPDPYVRGVAVMGMCETLRRHPDNAPPEMASNCPSGAPAGADGEPQAVRFWTNWWDQNREVLRKSVILPAVIPPSRYARAPQTVEPPRKITPGMRFETLVNMMYAPPAHAHGPNGEMVAPPPGPPDPFGNRLGTADREALLKVTAATAGKLLKLDRRTRDAMNAARLQSARPGYETMQALQAERESAVHSGLAELQSKLSPEGWAVVQAFLSEAGGVSFSVGTQPSQ